MSQWFHYIVARQRRSNKCAPLMMSLRWARDLDRQTYWVTWQIMFQQRTFVRPPLITWFTNIPVVYSVTTFKLIIPRWLRLLITTQVCPVNITLQLSGAYAHCHDTHSITVTATVELHNEGSLKCNNIMDTILWPKAIHPWNCQIQILLTGLKCVCTEWYHCTTGHSEWLRPFRMITAIQNDYGHSEWLRPFRMITYRSVGNTCTAKLLYYSQSFVMKWLL